MEHRDGYRAEIDGLRAVAVAAVIANHFSSSVLPGGYLGVDVFFVISGYVISKSLASQTQLGTAAFLTGFYMRRMKRLLPALFVCLVLTAFIGSLFIDPTTADYSRMMNSGAWALLGASNIYFFAKATDYFAFAAELNPFLHTWSLGVEEQFYLVFPALFLWLVRAGGAKSLLTRQMVFTAAVALSLAAFLLLLPHAEPAAYFLMPPRFWELGLGYLAFLYLSDPGPLRLQHGATTLAGATLLATAFLLSVEHQGIATVAAVLGSVMVIVGLQRGQFLHTLLSLRAVVWIGLISYSLYLWHWSVLVIGRWTVGVSLHTAPLLLVLTLGLAAASYYLVERPLRSRSWSPSALSSIGYGLTAAVTGFLCILALPNFLRGALYTGSPAILQEAGVDSLLSERRVAGVRLWQAPDCVLRSDDDIGKTIDPKRCALAGHYEGRRFLVVGDSFSAAELELLDGLREQGLGSVILTSSWGASPVPEVPNTSPWAKSSDYYWRTVVPALAHELRHGDFLVIVSDAAALTPKVKSEASGLGLQQLAEGLERISAELHARGVNVIFQTATSYMREARCTPTMATAQWFNIWEPSVCNYYSRIETLARRQPLDEVLGELQASLPNFYVLDLLPAFCPGPICKIRADDGTYLYRDISSHPSVEASQRARPRLVELVELVEKAIADDAEGRDGPVGDTAPTSAISP